MPATRPQGQAREWENGRSGWRYSHSVAPHFITASLAPCHLQELFHRSWYVIVLGKTSAKLVGNIHRHVAGPALSGIEGDDTPGTAVLIIQQVPNKRLVVGIRFSGLSRQTRPKCPKSSNTKYVSPLPLDGTIDSD